jgi:hypothetical protein
MQTQVQGQSQVQVQAQAQGQSQVQGQAQAQGQSQVQGQVERSDMVRQAHHRSRTERQRASGLKLKFSIFDSYDSTLRTGQRANGHR